MMASKCRTLFSNSAIGKQFHGEFITFHEGWQLSKKRVEAPVLTEVCHHNGPHRR